jgi:hypothetical protein
VPFFQSRRPWICRRETSLIQHLLRHESERTAGALRWSERRPAGCKQGQITSVDASGGGEKPPRNVSRRPGFSLAFHLRCVQFGTSMGLISDLLRDSPLKPEQLENIAVIEKRMQDEKLSANRELDRLKGEFDRVRTELDQARGLVRMLEQEVAEWRRQIKSGFDDSAQPGAEAGS